MSQAKQIWKFTNACTDQERAKSLRNTWMRLSIIILIAPKQITKRIAPYPIGRKGRCESTVRKILEADWNHWPSHMELANLAKNESQWQKAEMHLKIVLDLILETGWLPLFWRRFKSLSGNKRNSHPFRIACNNNQQFGGYKLFLLIRMLQLASLR